MVASKDKLALLKLEKDGRILALGIPTQKIVLFTGFLMVVAIVPAFLHTQWFTGPLVNAILILTCVLVGPMEAVLLGLVPSSIALASGLLPLPLAPMVPFIMMGNALFVAVFFYVNHYNYWLALIVAALLKFVFLLLVVHFLMSDILAGNLVANLAVMMSWPQFVTALIGGGIAFGILKNFRNKLFS